MRKIIFKCGFPKCT